MKTRFKAGKKYVDHKLKVIDWLVHGGHQYEFFKLDYAFYCANLNGTQPMPEQLGRPRNKNVNYVTQLRLKKMGADVIMVRSPVKPSKYSTIRGGKSSPAGIAVIQTAIPFKVPPWVKSVVWNSEYSMMKYRDQFGGKKHYHIPHGFDPEEFCSLDIVRKKEMLAAVSIFEKRGAALGLSDWKWVSDKLGGSALLGHGNKGLEESIGSFPLEELVEKYNSYAVFLNTTKKSAMPRVRGEAMMCGTPIVTTNNYGIKKYLTHGESCMFADNKHDMYKYVKKIIASKQMQEDLGGGAREAALNHFHIKDFLDRWQKVFDEARR